MRLQSGAREPVSDADLDEAAHFSKFAFAAYGYMLYVWSKPQWKCAPLQRGSCERAQRAECPAGPAADAERAAERVWLEKLALGIQGFTHLL